VPLSREWEFVQSYLDLERIRLGDRLCVTLNADEEALRVPIPPFALQPLVENAILHSVAPRASGGRVDVSASRSDGWLCLAVCDDGPGTTEAAVAASPRMGLRLLQERLGALYGGRARLTYETPASGGFRVRVDLPDGLTPEAV
jgi:sensor histidine kinase YesM